MGQGLITSLWCIDCQTAGCPNTSQSSTRYQTDAISMWRRHGWRIRRKKWMCPDCIKRENNHYGISTPAQG